MNSLARRVPAALPGPSGGRCAIVLAEGDAAKARLLSGSVSELLARWDGLRPGLGAGAPPLAAPLVIRARDLHSDASVLVLRLSADNGVASRASETLHAEALALLDETGTRGGIPRLLDRLRGLESELAQALGEEEGLAGRIDDLHAGLAAAFELERERAHCQAEFERWGALLHLVGDWRRLQAARREVEPLAGFGVLAPDTPRRMSALAARRATVDTALLGLVQRRAELQRERDSLRIETGTDAIAADTVRLGGELAAYRSRLLELAALRARLSELEQGANAGVRRLGAEWDESRVAATAVTAERAAEVRQWQARFGDNRAARERTDGLLAAARVALDRAATAVRTDLGGDTSADGDGDDAAWRAVWQLRAALDELWQVQSRAEGRARAVRDREAELVSAEAQGRWRPSPLLERRLGLLTVLAGLGGLWGNFTGAQHWQFAAVAAAVFGVARLAASLRRRWATGHDLRLVGVGDRLRRDIIEQRRGRDEDWRRAAQLTSVVSAASRRLDLDEPVTLEAVEAREQELSARLRSEGARTELTRRLVELLRAQEEEQTASQQAADAQQARQRLEQDWEAWRAATDLPADLDAEQGEGWLARLRDASATLAARDAARTSLRDTEPAIAAWENDVRSLLRQAGLGVSGDLCGRELATALGGLRDRVRRVETARTHCARLDAELANTEHLQVEHEQERAGLVTQWAQLLADSATTTDAELRDKVDAFSRWLAARDAAGGIAMEIDDTLAVHGSPVELRAELEREDEGGWMEKRAAAAERVATMDRKLAAAAAGRAALDAALDSARGSSGVAALRDERERLLAEVADAAKRWQTSVLAAALLDDARREQLDAQRHDLLRTASNLLNTLSAGAYSLAGTVDGLFLLDREARRTPVAAASSQAVGRKVALSLLLAYAAQRTSDGRPMPIVLDDILGVLPAEEVSAVAAQIAALARLQPTLYLTTPERHSAVTAALASVVAIG